MNVNTKSCRGRWWWKRGNAWLPIATKWGVVCIGEEAGMDAARAEFEAAAWFYELLARKQARADKSRIPVYKFKKPFNKLSVEAWNSMAREIPSKVFVTPNVCDWSFKGATEIKFYIAPENTRRQIIKYVEAKLDKLNWPKNRGRRGRGLGRGKNSYPWARLEEIDLLLFEGKTLSKAARSLLNGKKQG